MMSLYLWFYAPYAAFLDWRESRQWFGFGRCRLCGWWSFNILKSESAHEECWLETK